MEYALRYTYESASRYGHVIFHVDDENMKRWVREVVPGADVVVINGLGEGRAWFVEYIANTGEIGVMCDSHVYFESRPTCHDLCQFREFNFSFNEDPRMVKNKLYHYGHVYWDRKHSFFAFECWHGYKPFSNSPVQFVHPIVARRVVDLYSKYGLKPIFPGYGSDMEQFYVSAWRLGFSGTCVPVSFGHRSNAGAVDTLFWKKRWEDPTYVDKWFQANVCFLKLHMPKEYWHVPKSNGYDPALCRLVDDVIVKKINDEFIRGYREFLQWARNYIQINM